MGATYKDENQKDQLIVMGCYGIGVTRTLAAVVEQHHDENGIIWPVSVAPYHVIITVMKPDDAIQAEERTARRQIQGRGSAGNPGADYSRKRRGRSEDRI